MMQQAPGCCLRPLPCTFANPAELVRFARTGRDQWIGDTMLMHRRKDASSLGLSCTYAKPLHGCRGLLADTVPFFSGISSTLSTFPNDSNLWPTWLDDTVPGRPLSHRRTGSRLMFAV